MDRQETKASKRRTLKSSDTKLLLQRFSERFPQFIIDQGKAVIDEVLVDGDKLFLVNSKPFAILTGNELYPSLLNEELLKTLPSVVVDMGAVPHVCNGADIMRPGIKEIRGEFERGSVVLIEDIKFGKPIGICVSEISSRSMREMPKGRAARNVHYVGDGFWEAAKKF